MAGDPTFLILKPSGGWLPAHNETRLLGAAVKNCFDPLENSTLNPLKHYDKKQHPLIDRKFDELVLEKNDVQASSGELLVKGIAHLFCRRSDQKLFNLKSKVIHVKRLTGLDDFWNKLIAEDVDFTPKVTGWLREKCMLGLKAKHEVYLVTGILMCQDVEVASTDQEAKIRRRNFEAPLGQVAEAVAASQGARLSTGGIGDVGGSSSKEQFGKTYFAAKGSKKEIFAVQLKRIKLKDNKLVLGSQGPKITDDRRLGDEKTQGIVLEDITADDWIALIEDTDQTEDEE